jgi:RHS repeat-associated protein
MRYDTRERLVQLGLAPAGFDLGHCDTVPPPKGWGQPRTLANDCVSYDDVGNPVRIDDERPELEWTPTTKPVSRAITYDDFYRATNITYNWADNIGNYASPGPTASSTTNPVPRVNPARRIGSETYYYDPLGSLAASSDDLGLFFDRSLGAITNGGSSNAAFQLQYAEHWSGAGTGNLFAYYDPAGNLAGMTVYRDGACEGGRCAQVYRYDWDEVGRLARARRFDMTTPVARPGGVALQTSGDVVVANCASSGTLLHDGSSRDGCVSPSAVARPPLPSPSKVRPDQYPYPAVPSATADVDMKAAYDARGGRVLRSYANAGTTNITYSAEIFASLRLAHTTWDGTKADYRRDESTEEVYLTAGGTALGRVTSVNGVQHVLLSMGDELGSTTAIVDRDSGSLVERKTYTAYGQVESDYHAPNWANFREKMEFAGAEEDYEFALSYMGARYYSPNLGRWISADPATIHGAASDLNPYAYVHGHVFAATDPTGLGEDDDGQDVAVSDDLKQTVGCNSQACEASSDNSKPGDKEEHWNDRAIVFFPQVVPHSSIHAASPTKAAPTAPAPSGGGAVSTVTSQEKLDAATAGYLTSLVDMVKGTVTAIALFMVASAGGAAQVVTNGGNVISAINHVAERVTPTAPPANYADYRGYELRTNYNAGRTLGVVVTMTATLVIGGVVASARAAFGMATDAAGGAAEGSTYVYQLVDEGGDAVYYGISNDPARRLAEHALEATKPFSGMQVISEGQPLAQAQALETSLIQQAHAEGRLIYNVAPQSISPLIPVQVPSTVVPSQTLLNPALYPH